MSALATTNTSSAAIKTLTGRIINAQKDEISVMQRWLRERGRPVPEIGSHASIWVHMNTGKSHVAQHHFWIPLDRRKAYKRMNMCSYSHTTKGFHDFSSYVCFSMMGSDFSVKESGINSVAVVVGCTRLRMEIWQSGIHLH